MTDRTENTTQKNNELNKRHKILNSVLCLLAIWLMALIFGDSLLYAVKPVIPTANRHQKGKIFLEYADSLSLNEMHPEYQVLSGHVKFRKGDMYMYCDSAHFYDKENKMNAFGNVKMEQGDTLFVYSDVLYYDGMQEIARLRKVQNGVRLEHRNTTLFTDSLDYDLIANIGYYFKGGEISDDKNTITSIYGQYAPDTKDSEFLYDVVLTNNEKKFVLNTDTLLYNTQTHIADIVGHTTIESDSSIVYTDRGWYNTDKDKVQLLNRSLVVGKDGQTLTGDTIVYDRANGFGEVFGNMVLTDTAKSAVLTGGYGYHNEKDHPTRIGDGIFTRRHRVCARRHNPHLSPDARLIACDVRLPQRAFLPHRCARSVRLADISVARLNDIHAPPPDTLESRATSDGQRHTDTSERQHSRQSLSAGIWTDGRTRGRGVLQPVVGKRNDCNIHRRQTPPP